VLKTVAAGPPRDRVTGVAEQLVWLLVYAHHRVVRTAVDRQDVLHPRRELRIRARRNGPALPQVRPKFRLFSTRPMVEWSRFGMSSASPACLIRETVASPLLVTHASWPVTVPAGPAEPWPAVTGVRLPSRLHPVFTWVAFVAAITLGGGEVM